jgi:glutaryl-CoA dehydrogenase
MNILRTSKLISSNQQLIVDSVKSFCKNELSPIVRKNYRNEYFNKEIYKQFGKAGLLGSTIQGYGCLGESYKTYGLIAKEIEKVDSGFRSMVSVQSSLVMYPIYKFANKSIKENYLHDLASGEKVGAFGLTEPVAGSDTTRLSTVAVEKDDHYLLNGTKTWITNAPIADIFVVWAKLQDGTLGGFVLDRKMGNITTPVIEGKMSLRTSITGMIFMDDVKVPKENKLNVSGFKGPFTCLNSARLGIAFGVLGASEFCLEKVIDYSKDRILFDQKLAEKQLFQYKLAHMVAEHNLALLGCLHLAEHTNENEMYPEAISLLKMNSCSKALTIARECRDILGGNGITEEYDIFRHMCNLETVKTYEGTHDIHSLIIGNYITNMKAF